MQLVIGTRKWSSWSMRPWLVMKRTGLDFEDIVIPLRTLETAALLAPYSPSSQCPVLIDDGLKVWDSLAICEYLAEKVPGLWPEDVGLRAQGRASCAQMHAGFLSLRGECSVDLSAPVQNLELTEATAGDVRKIVTLWRELLATSSGPFLLGKWSIADAYWTPVATRFRTYGVNLADYGDDNGACAGYATLLLEQPEYLAWEKLALESSTA